MNSIAVCPTCNRKMPVSKEIDKKLSQDLARARASITSLSHWQHWPGDGPNQRIAMEGAIEVELTRLHHALTDPKLLWSIYRRSQKGGYTTMEHLSTNQTDDLIGVAAGEQNDRNVAIANGEITERAQDTIIDRPLVTHVCIIEPSAHHRSEVVSMQELTARLSWCENPQFYLERIAAGEKVVTDHVIYEPVLADLLPKQPEPCVVAPGTLDDPWLKSDPRVEATTESW